LFGQLHQIATGPYACDYSEAGQTHLHFKLSVRRRNLGNQTRHALPAGKISLLKCLAGNDLASRTAQALIIPRALNDLVEDGANSLVAQCRNKRCLSGKLLGVAAQREGRSFLRPTPL
jgi:hypothetical protein